MWHTKIINVGVHTFWFSIKITKSKIGYHLLLVYEANNVYEENKLNSSN